MVEFVWQASVVKFIGVIGCLVVGVIAFCSLAIAKSPQGADDDSLSSLNWLAVWIVRVVVGVLLLVVAGMFYEREGLAEKIPRIPREGRVLWIAQRGVLFVVPFFVPVVHLLFTMSVLLYGIGMILVRTEDPLLKLIFLACWNGCCYLGVSFIMLWTGPTEDYGPARVITACYAGIGGTMLPSFAAIASATNIAILLRFSIAFYAIAALHAATVVMQAVGNYLYQIVDDLDPVFSTEACMPALESVFGTLMNGTAEFLTENYGTSTETTDDVVNSCPVVEDTSTQPCDPIKWYVILTGALLGLWVSSLALLWLLLQKKARVAPANAPPIRKERARRRARNLMFAKIGAVLGALIIGGGIGVPGYFTFWVCPDEGWVEEGEPIIWNTTISTTVTSTTYTSTSTTFTSTTTSTGSSTTRTTTTTTRTTTLTTTTRTLAATPNNGDDETTSAPTNTTAAPTNTTLVDPCEDVVTIVETVFAREGCHCGELPARPWWAWTAVPSEQVASLWCSLGNAAPVILFTFLYIYDCYLCSLLYEILGVHLVQEEQHRFQQRQERMRRQAFECGTSIERAQASTESRVKVWHEAPREALPRPVAGHGTERLFDI